MQYLTVRDIEEYFYCPRVFYFNVVCGINIEKGLWKEIGKKYHETAEEFLKNIFGESVEKCVKLKSEELRIKGEVDYIVREGIPVEVKYSPRVRMWWKYTIVAYAILLEQSRGVPVKIGYLLLMPQKELVPLRLRDDDREMVVLAIRKCLKMIEEGMIPRPNTSNCRNCDYKNICEKLIP